MAAIPERKDPDIQEKTAAIIRDIPSYPWECMASPKPQRGKAQQEQLAPRLPQRLLEQDRLLPLRSPQEHFPQQRPESQPASAQRATLKSHPPVEIHHGQ